MPELPEIQTIVTGLNRLILHKTIQSFDWNWAKSFPNSEAAVHSALNRSVTGVRRRGKAVLLDLDNGRTLLVHLKMTGQLVVQPPDEESPFPDRSTRVVIRFTDGTTLYFNDQRKFGWVKILTKEELAVQPFLASLGPEPLSRRFTGDHFRERLLRHRETTVKAALLNQTVLAGIGNIYCDEALFLAGILPDRKVKSLSDQEIRRLHRSLRKVLRISIELGGSTRRNYLSAEGVRGHYLDQAYVYGRDGEPCRTCGTPIRKTRVAGRGTHFCPHCQS
ncbi:DNA-formamidopyrimidine glycosylase [Clostridiaceae bacterium HFYG-1003]|nr:DNA-formamidopyrimidine glycosylase [Clostridiaceae bacterium HFYG-1003]